MISSVSEIQAVAERLERVERENRRLKRWGAVALIGIAAVVLTGQAKASRVVQAEKFVVQDAEGKVRAELGTFPDGKMALVLFDQKEKSALSFGCWPTAGWASS